MNKNPMLDTAFSDAKKWRAEAESLRTVLLKAGLSEELKWGKPCYTHDGKNVCIIQRMNEFLALMFFKGALLKDPDGILEVQGPNSRAGYRIRFTCVQDVVSREASIRACILDAMAVEKAGLKIEKAKDLEYPEELVEVFDEDAEFKEAFERPDAGKKTRVHHAFYQCQAIKDESGANRKMPTSHNDRQRFAGPLRILLIAGEKQAAA